MTVLQLTVLRLCRKEVGDNGSLLWRKRKRYFDCNLAMFSYSEGFLGDMLSRPLLPVVSGILEVIHCVPQRCGVGVERLVHLSVLRPHFLRQIDEIGARWKRGRRFTEQFRAGFITLSYGL